jgi:hypothetical protein
MTSYLRRRQCILAVTDSANEGKKMGIPLACISDFDADTLMNETVYFGFATLPATGARTSNRRAVTSAAPPRRPNQAK